MKRISLLAILLVATAAGCARSQVPPNPTVYACPPTNGTAYTPLDQGAPATGTTYADVPTVGQYCYIAQPTIASTGQTAVPSNVAGPVNFLAADKSVTVSWTMPTSGPAPTGTIISRAAAVPSTLLPATMGTPEVAALAPPLLPDAPEPQLTASAVRPVMDVHAVVSR